VAVHGPDEEWFALGEGLLLGGDEGGKPGDGGPGFVGRLEFLVKLGEQPGGEFGGGEGGGEGEDGGEEGRFHGYRIERGDGAGILSFDRVGMVARWKREVEKRRGGMSWEG